MANQHVVRTRRDRAGLEKGADRADITPSSRSPPMSGGLRSLSPPARLMATDTTDKRLSIAVRSPRLERVPPNRLGSRRYVRVRGDARLGVVSRAAERQRA